MGTVYFLFQGFISFNCVCGYPEVDIGKIVYLGSNCL